MNFLLFSSTILVILQFTFAGPLRLQKRAAFYIANETACVVDNTVYSNGDPIPTDDPCEACKCRPPGFACVLKDCKVKPGCRAVRRTGHCCPDYICENPNVPFEGKNPYLIEKQPSVEETSTESIITPGVSYVPDTTEKPIVDTTVIEIFHDETKKPELHLNHDVVDSQTEKTEDSPSVEQDNKQEVSTVIEEVKTTTSEAIEIEKSESSEEESSTATKVHFNHDDSISEVEDQSEHTSVSPDEESHTTSVPEETAKYSTEADSQSNDIHTTVVVKTVDVESEEPDNALEPGSAVSNYGKSLKFPDQDETSNITVFEDAEIKNISTDESHESKLTENSGESHKSTPEVSDPIKATLSDKTDSSDKNLYYNSKENLQTDPVDSITTEISAKEHAQAFSTETIPALSTKSENLLESFNDKLEGEATERVSESSSSSIKPDGEIEKVKEATTVFSTSESDVTASSISEKVKGDDGTIDDTSKSTTHVEMTSTSVL